ncbi:MAG: hypothetical protein HUJ78_02435 [Mogibacterium sp.]|nr:hypothetical protein [Mogibacterium sp.]
MKKLNFIQITALYVGIIMGAGFASGRECWQYFGVFGQDGFNGIYAVVIFFIIISCMLAYIAISKGTNDLGELISPVNNPTINNIIGIVMAAIYYSMIIAMSAAGGSLLNQQFGMHKAVGGIIIVILVIITVLGDFERVSKVFSLLVPVLFVFGILVISLAIKSNFGQSGPTTGYDPGDMTPTWPIAAIVFCSYNCMGMVTMVGSSALNAKNSKHAFAGAVLGSIMLGILTLLLLKAMLTDMAFSASLDLPMLGFAARISKPLNIIYAIVLYGAVYSTAASTYYGFSTKLPNNKWKKPIIYIGAIVGFVIGLSGFKVIVEYLYSAQGYIGMLFIVLIIINFFKEFIGNRKASKQ